jgi:hypothetical protein
MVKITDITKEFNLLELETDTLGLLSKSMVRCNVSKWNKKDKRDWARLKKECSHCHKNVRQGDMSTHKKSKRCRLIKRRLKAEYQLTGRPIWSNSIQFAIQLL